MNLPLATAYINQQDTNDWTVFDQNGDKIDSLDGTLTPQQAMSYLHFARPFEVESFKKGIEQGKELKDFEYSGRIEHAKLLIQELTEENERLSVIILKRISKE